MSEKAWIPVDLKISWFSFLPVEDLVKASQTCLSWVSLVQKTADFEIERLTGVPPPQLSRAGKLKLLHRLHNATDRENFGYLLAWAAGNRELTPFLHKLLLLRDTIREDAGLPGGLHEVNRPNAFSEADEDVRALYTYRGKRSSAAGTQVVEYTSVPPLIVAASRGNVDAVNLLLLFGEGQYDRHKANEKALSIAVEQGNVLLVATLMGRLPLRPPLHPPDVARRLGLIREVRNVYDRQGRYHPGILFGPYDIASSISTLKYRAEILAAAGVQTSEGTVASASANDSLSKRRRLETADDVSPVEIAVTELEVVENDLRNREWTRNYHMGTYWSLYDTSLAIWEALHGRIGDVTEPSSPEVAEAVAVPAANTRFPQGGSISRRPKVKKSKKDKKSDSVPFLPFAQTTLDNLSLRLSVNVAPGSLGHHPLLAGTVLTKYESIESDILSKLPPSSPLKFHAVPLKDRKCLPPPLPLATDLGRVAANMISLRIRLNIGPSEGKTPLILALERGRLEIVWLLLSHGSMGAAYGNEIPEEEGVDDEVVQANVENNGGEQNNIVPAAPAVTATPADDTVVKLSPDQALYHISRGKSSLCIEPSLVRNHTVEELSDIFSIRRDVALVNTCPVDGNPPLSIAVARGDLISTALLLHWGARINRKGRKSVPPLLAATNYGHEAIVSLLLRVGLPLQKARELEPIVHETKIQREAERRQRLTAVGRSFTPQPSLFPWLSPVSSARSALRPLSRTASVILPILKRGGSIEQLVDAISLEQERYLKKINSTLVRDYKRHSEVVRSLDENWHLSGLDALSLFADVVGSSLCADPTISLPGGVGHQELGGTRFTLSAASLGGAVVDVPHFPSSFQGDTGEAELSHSNIMEMLGLALLDNEKTLSPVSVSSFTFRHRVESFLKLLELEAPSCPFPAVGLNAYNFLSGSSQSPEHILEELFFYFGLDASLLHSEPSSKSDLSRGDKKTPRRSKAILPPPEGSVRREEPHIDTCEPAIISLLSAAAVAAAANAASNSAFPDLLPDPVAPLSAAELYLPPEEAALGVPAASLVPNSFQKYKELFGVGVKKSKSGLEKISLIGTSSNGSTNGRVDIIDTPNALLHALQLPTTPSYIYRAREERFLRSLLRQDVYSLLQRSRVTGAKGIGCLALRTPLDVSSVDESGYTALFSAASNGHLRLVKLLLHAGSDPTALTMRGKTPVYGAVEKAHEEVVTLLLPFYTANQLRQNTTYGTNVIHAAQRAGSVRIKEAIERHCVEWDEKNAKEIRAENNRRRKELWDEETGEVAMKMARLRKVAEKAGVAASSAAAVTSSVSGRGSNGSVGVSNASKSRANSAGPASRTPSVPAPRASIPSIPRITTLPSPTPSQGNEAPPKTSNAVSTAVIDKPPKPRSASVSRVTSESSSGVKEKVKDKDKSSAPKLKLGHIPAFVYAAAAAGAASITGANNTDHGSAPSSRKEGKVDDITESAAGSGSVATRTLSKANSMKIQDAPHPSVTNPSSTLVQPSVSVSIETKGDNSRPQPVLATTESLRAQRSAFFETLLKSSAAALTAPPPPLSSEVVERNVPPASSSSLLSVVTATSEDKKKSSGTPASMVAGEVKATVNVRKNITPTASIVLSSPSAKNSMGVLSTPDIQNSGLVPTASNNGLVRQKSVYNASKVSIDPFASIQPSASSVLINRSLPDLNSVLNTSTEEKKRPQLSQEEIAARDERIQAREAQKLERIAKAREELERRARELEEVHQNASKSIGGSLKLAALVYGEMKSKKKKNQNINRLDY